MEGIPLVLLLRVQCQPPMGASAITDVRCSFQGRDCQCGTHHDSRQGIVRLTPTLLGIHLQKCKLLVADSTWIMVKMLNGRQFGEGYAQLEGGHVQQVDGKYNVSLSDQMFLASSWVFFVFLMFFSYYDVEKQKNTIVHQLLVTWTQYFRIYYFNQIKKYINWDKVLFVH